MQAFLDSISNFIQSLGTGLQALMTFVISMIPIIELRGAMPIAAAAGLPWYIALSAAVVGNMLPVPFILLFVRRIFAFMKKHMPPLRRFVEKLEMKAERNKAKVVKYETFGLCIFVAIPLPGTGAWTGALVAALMGLRLRDAIPSILLGVVLAGIIMTLISYGVVSIFSFS